MASKSRRKVGSGEAEQAEYLKAKIKDTGELVDALRQGIADIALKLQGQMKAMGEPPAASLSLSLALARSRARSIHLSASLRPSAQGR